MLPSRRVPRTLKNYLPIKDYRRKELEALLAEAARPRQEAKR
jgi:hypothetical protein